MADIGGIGVSQLARLDELLAGVEGGVPAVVEVHHTPHAVAFHRLHNALGVLAGGGQGFLDEQVPLVIGKAAGDVGVGKVWCDDGHGVDVGLFRHLVVVGIDLFDAEFIGDGLSPLTVHVTDGHRLGIAVLPIDIGVGPAPGAGAYDTHFNFLFHHSFTLIPSKILRTIESALDGARRHTGDQMLLEQPEDDDHWDGDHDGPGHQRAPVGVVLPLEAGDTDGERPVAVAAQQDAGEHVFVPTGDEGEDG